jgi:glucose-6-phosphate dehydrogenase assembly protein OpcA
MSSIFNALPGLEVPVGAIGKNMAQMWADTAASGGAAPASDDAKATQVNFVLHLGFQTTAEDAAAQFDTVVRFSRRYPCRVVVLCPLRENEAPGVTEMRAKIFGECHLGRNKGDTRCVEFVILSYPQSARRFLENQVSICLSTDLPLYYWAHRFSASAKLADYHYLLSQARRVLIDSAIAPEDTLTYPWPKPEALRDLVYSRLLPVRQTVGQFLAGHAPEKLTDGLAKVTVTHGPELSAEGRVLMGWFKRRLTACEKSMAEFVVAAGEAHVLTAAFAYADGAKQFHWQGDVKSGHAKFECNFGGETIRLPGSVSLLSPEKALSEAMFF